jgi:regulator of replication initiation timing
VIDAGIRQQILGKPDLLKDAHHLLIHADRARQGIDLLGGIYTQHPNAGMCQETAQRGANRAKPDHNNLERRFRRGFHLCLLRHGSFHLPLLYRRCRHPMPTAGTLRPRAVEGLLR